MRSTLEDVRSMEGLGSCFIKLNFGPTHLWNQKRVVLLSIPNGGQLKLTSRMFPATRRHGNNPFERGLSCWLERERELEKVRKFPVGARLRCLLGRKRRKSQQDSSCDCLRGFLAFTVGECAKNESHAMSGLTLDMSGRRRWAKPACGCPLDGRVRHDSQLLTAFFAYIPST